MREPPPAHPANSHVAQRKSQRPGKGSLEIRECMNYPLLEFSERTARPAVPPPYQSRKPQCFRSGTHLLTTGQILQDPAESRAPAGANSCEEVSKRTLGFDEVEAIPIEILEDSDRAERLLGWGTHERHPALREPFVVAPEVVGFQEHKDAAAGLVSYARVLPF